MSKLRVTLLVAVVPLLILLTDRPTRGEMSGDSGRPIVMQGVVAGEGGRIAAASRLRSSASDSC